MTSRNRIAGGFKVSVSVVRCMCVCVCVQNPTGKVNFVKEGGPRDGFVGSRAILHWFLQSSCLI